LEQENDVFPVVIIGSGIAGLAAAAHLAARDVPPLVLEASSAWAGGRLCGGDEDRFEYQERIWSFKPDHGVHAVWGGYHNMRAMLERFTGVQLRPSEGEDWVNRWGRRVRVVEAGNAVRSRWIPAPFHYLQLLFRPRFWLTITPYDFLSLPGLLFSILWTVGLDPLKEQVALDRLKLEEYFRGWTRNLRVTFTGLGANLLAANPEAINLTAFIAAIRFYTMLRRDSWQMHYFTGNSHDQLIQPLIDSIEQNGGRVVYGATAQRLERCQDGWRVVLEDDKRRGLRSVFARHVTLAINAPAAKRLLGAGQDTASEAAKLRFPDAVRTVAVRLWFNAQPKTGASSGMCTGDFQIDNFFWLHRLYDEFSAWRENGGSAVEVHIYGSEAMLDQPDKNLLIQAVNEIQLAFPELKGHFVYGVVRRNSRTHTVFRVPTKESLHVITPWQNVYACGDWIGYDTPSMWMERAVTTGIAAANEVLRVNGREIYRILQPKRAEVLVIGFGGFVRLIRWVFRPLVIGLRWVKRQQK
jgi:carotenoid phi-ring synthase / carotenoid chi-ring synthase